MTHKPALIRQQRGAVLIITLVMLVLVTIVVISSVRSTTMEERMAGNARDRDKALQAAEAVVLKCLALVKTTNASGFTTAGGTILSPAGVVADPVWEVDANWASTSPNSHAEALASSYGLAEDPRCMVEGLGTGTGSYRVTGRAVGASADSVVILQATYSTE
jgi:type IV pilus assembly protein PilX